MTRPLNLGVVAHIDAGKTSLTERLLYDTGATSVLGRVDAGTARTDAMDLERRRGITIRAAVTAVHIGDVDVNLIDTPGHSDFVVEVERSLGVLDAVVLVLSAVEGVQPQTVALWRSLRRVGIPTLLFINKVDRGAADPDAAIAAIRERLSSDVVPLTRVSYAGTAVAAVRRASLRDSEAFEPVVAADDPLLQRWADGEAIAETDLVDALRGAVGRGELFPVLAGSAVTGAGVDHLRWAIEHLLPRDPAADGALAATVFAVDRAGATRRTWLRLWSGELHVRDRFAIGAARPERITGITVETPEGPQTRLRVAGGHLAAAVGLGGARIGDVIGTPPRRGAALISGATFEAEVAPDDPEDDVRMMQALRVLAEEDPLIDLRVDGDVVRVRIHGEVQREVIAATLEERFGVPVRFTDARTACIERLTGTALAIESLGEDGNPYLATVGLELTPLPDTDEVVFSPGVQRGRLVPSFIAATEEGVRSALEQGRHGWPVLGVAVTMTASRYYPRQSHAHQKFDKAMSSTTADFRSLAPVVVAACLRQTGTRVCEPIERFDATEGTGRFRRLGGLLPSARVATVRKALPDLTGGEGVLITQFDHHRTVPDDAAWARPRTGADPADRIAWFRAHPR